MNDEVNINEELNQIKLHLRQLSIPDLQEIMPGVGDFMHEMGETITPLSLSEAIVNIHNTAIFEDKKIKKDRSRSIFSIIANFGPTPVIEVLFASSAAKSPMT